MLRQSYNVDIGYISLFEVIGTVAAAAILHITIYVTEVNIVTLAKHRLTAP